ncbi:OmpA domain-containing protein [Streptococcus pneumoniae]|nr:OmpA domain-containing protein [Streptococcus pneumoniae]
MEMKQKISDMMESHYKEFIQALISIETGIENQQDLEDLYTYYMRTDSVSLLSSDLETSPQEVEMEIEL